MTVFQLEYVERICARAAKGTDVDKMRAFDQIVMFIREGVHRVGYAAQGDIEIYCDKSQTEAAWGQVPDGSGIFRAANHRLYTFDAAKVTCAACMTMVGRSAGILDKT